MRRKWLVHTLCLLAVLCISLTAGCNAFTPERNRMRMHSIRTDLDRMVDDVDWILGLQEPTPLYNPMRP
jgi:hypothetical protein